MSLLQRLDNELKEAMKSSDRLKVSVLRMAKAAIKNRQIEKGGELSDDEIVSVLSTMSKQRRESIEQFTKGGRADLAESERQELNILHAYMPEQLSTEDLDRIILKAIEESSARGPQDRGKVMRILMPKVKGAADGKAVNQRVKELLESKKVE